MRRLGSEIRSQRLARRSQVQLDAGSEPDLAPDAGQLDRSPTGDRLEPQLDRTGPRRQGGEVEVVADRPHRPADGRIDGAVRPLRGGEGHLDRVCEERAHGDAVAGARVERNELAVRAEPAIGAIDAVEDVFHGPPGPPGIRVMHDEPNAGAQRPPAHRLGARRLRDSGVGHEPPVVASAAPLDDVTVVLEPVSAVGLAVAAASVVVDVDASETVVGSVVVTAAVVTAAAAP